MEGAKPVPVREIIRSPGFLVVFSVSVVSVVAQDLIVVYLPLIGTERSIAVDVIGSLLAVRAFAAVFSRLFFSRLNSLLGSTRLMVTSTIAGALAFGAHRSADLAAADVCGDRRSRRRARHLRDHGDLQPAGLVSSEVRGTANSLRTGGTRLGQVVIPFFAGLLAAAMGVASVFLVLGASLAVAATAAVRV